MKIAIGSDHKGFPLKEHLKPFLAKAGHEVIDAGCPSVESVDYPDYAFTVGEMVGGGAVDRGILICMTGIGMSIAANKVKGVRASLCRTVGDARMTRMHNDSNVLVLGVGSLEDPALHELVTEWIATPFEGGRHARRRDKIAAYELKE